MTRTAMERKEKDEAKREEEARESEMKGREVDHALTAEQLYPNWKHGQRYSKKR